MKHSFKQFLIEGGFPFAYVLDDNKLDIFGREEKDLVKTNKKKKPLTDEEKLQNKQRKLVSFAQYTKVTQD